MTTGILPIQAIRHLIESQALMLAEPPLPGQLQPASIDLRLGAVAYRVRASFLPGPGARVAAKLDDFALHAIDLTTGASKTGAIKWDLFYIPIDEGASVVAA